jgi:hypothetical protein
MMINSLQEMEKILKSILLFQIPVVNFCQTQTTCNDVVGTGEGFGWRKRHSIDVRLNFSHGGEFTAS